MGTAIYDAADTVVSLLKDNWTADRVPNVQKAWDKRSVGFGDSRSPQIILTPKTENITYFGLYGSDFWHDVTIDLDIRSYQNDVRHNNIVKEVNKIIKAKIRGADDYTDIRIIASYSRSHYMRNMFNHIVTVSLRKLNPS